MKKLGLIAALSALAACAPPVYTEAQRDETVAAFERYCMGPSYMDYRTSNQWRSCESNTLLLYRLDNGERYVGSVEELNRGTGELRVRWQSAPHFVDDEPFYPGSAEALPGKVVAIASVGRDRDRWRQLQELFESQTDRLTMRR